MVDSIKVLIVEDDALIAHNMKLTLVQNGYKVVGVAHNYEDAIFLLNNELLDIVLLDINLENNKTGFDLAEIIDSNFNLPYIFVTSYSDEETLKLAQGLTPYGYLVKPYNDHSLLTSIKIARSNFNKLKNLPSSPLSTLKLTKTELKVCELLCQGNSYNEISEAEFISVNTVKFHTKNIYSKLNVSNKAELINKIFKL